MTSGKKNYVCSLTGFACNCELGHGCPGTNRGPRLDPPPAAAVRLVKSARLIVLSAEEIIEEALSEIPFDRAFPNPELRQIMNRLKAARALIDEILN